MRTRQYLPHAFADDPAAQWEEDLFAVFNGGAPVARMGRVPHMLAKAIGASTTIVRVSSATAKKIRGKHNDVKFAELLEVATAFAQASVVRQGKLHLVFWFPSPATENRTVCAVIKATNKGHEVWLKTVYPISRRHLKSVRSKGLLLREAE